MVGVVLRRTKTQRFTDRCGLIMAERPIGKTVYPTCHRINQQEPGIPERRDKRAMINQPDLGYRGGFKHLSYTYPLDRGYLPYNPQLPTYLGSRPVESIALTR
jgi:hypothetical protein